MKLAPLKKYFKGFLQWLRNFGSVINYETTIIVNGKKVDPSSPEGLAARAELNRAQKELDETFDDLRDRVNEMSANFKKAGQR